MRGQIDQNEMIRNPTGFMVSLFGVWHLASSAREFDFNSIGRKSIIPPQSIDISSRCATPICWISLMLSMPFPNALTNYYLQIGLFFLLHNSQSNMSIFCLDKNTVCAAPTRRTKEKSLERIIHSIINLHISQSDCTTYLLFLFMFSVVYGIALNYEASPSRLLSQMVAHSVEAKENLS